MANGASGKQSESVGLVSQIPFGAVVGAPLKAAVDAQAAAAVACYDFISSVGFETDTSEEGDKETKTLGKVRDITFRFEREVPGEGSETTKSTMAITVPLLTVMPLPFIRIESLTVTYKVHITAEDTHTDSTTTGTSGSATIGGSAGTLLWKANFNATVSSKKDSTATNTSKYSVEQTMDVNVHAVQDDMPAGMAKILSIMTDAITVARG